MPATKEQIGITWLVIAWIVVTLVQSSVSIDANLKAKKWANPVGGETEVPPQVFIASNVINGLAIAAAIAVPAGLFYLNYKSSSGTPAIAAGSVLSGQSLTSWM
jgi:hypothetical protein